MRVASRQIVNCKNEKLAEMSWKDALIYSEVMDEYEQVFESEINLIPEDLYLKHTAFLLKSLK